MPRLQQRGRQAVRRAAVLPRRRHKVQRNLAQRRPARDGIDLLLVELRHVRDALPQRGRRARCRRAGRSVAAWTATSCWHARCCAQPVVLNADLARASMRR